MPQGWRVASENFRDGEGAPGCERALRQPQGESDRGGSERVRKAAQERTLGGSRVTQDRLCILSKCGGVCWKALGTPEGTAVPRKP